MTAKADPPKTPEERRAEILREIQFHADRIAALARELGGPAPQGSSMFVRNAVTADQFRASLRAMGKM